MGLMLENKKSLSDTLSGWNIMNKSDPIARLCKQSAGKVFGGKWDICEKCHKRGQNFKLKLKVLIILEDRGKNKK